MQFTCLCLKLGLTLHWCQYLLPCEHFDSIFGVTVCDSPSSLSTHVRRRLLRCLSMSMTTASSCTKRFVQCFLEFFDKPFNHSSQCGDLAISCCARKSSHCASNGALLCKLIRSGLVCLGIKRLAAFEIPHLSGFWYPFLEAPGNIRAR